MHLIQLTFILATIILTTVLITYHFTKGSDNTRPEAVTSKTSAYKTKTMHNLARLGVKVNDRKPNYYVRNK
ncbi:hypothetical protein DFP96_11110 [Listeria rocourtiae]|uniref:Uncharacterized protein n=1 Tax=Listeria rocourtiae TaxID=647910 RepID=A0A4R6ZI81_9LIST|nr:hypothetical protein DFP96_11110 [Listeria rocourtiae]